MCDRIPVAGMFFAMLRSALNGAGGCVPPGFGRDAADWEELYGLSARQGLLAVVYDGVMKLPADSRPPRALLVKWGVSAMALEDRYETQRTALKGLVALYDSNGIRSLLLKGMGLSLGYPVPAHRECGDIDIYMYSDFDRANSVIERMGIRMERHISKHSNFAFMGVPVENHFGFLEVDEAYGNKAFESYLKSIAGDGPRETFDIDGVEIDTGNLLFNAVFVICHAVTHFQTWGIVTRHFCDWGTFLAKYYGRFDYGEFRRVMAANGYMKLVDTFTLIAVQYLGFGFPEEIYPEADARLAARIMDDTLSYVDAPHAGDPSLAGRIKMKITGFRRIVSTKWKYDTTSRRAFYDRFWVSLRSAFRS